MNDNTKVFTDGPMHPDLFNGETPVRKLVDLEESGLRVYKVECTYYTEEQETHFVIAHEPRYAEDLAWERIHEESTGMDSAEVEEMSLDDELKDFMGRHRKQDGTSQTAREFLAEHFKKEQEKECTLTQN